MYEPDIHFGPPFLQEPMDSGEVPLPKDNCPSP